MPNKGVIIYDIVIPTTAAIKVVLNNNLLFFSVRKKLPRWADNIENETAIKI